MTVSSILIAMTCVAMITLTAMGALIVLLARPGRRQPANPEHLLKTGTKSRKDWKIWLFYFGIALIITIWTYWGALFFLGSVWILSLDPKYRAKEISFPNEVDRNSARGLYTWLFLSPLLTVPIMIYLMATLSYDASINERILAALLPGALHLLMLSNLTTKSQFLYRHAQQALFLASCRAGMAAIAMSIGSVGDGVWLFLLGNGSLWLFGTVWARNQAIRGECWWMTRKGEKILGTPTEAELDDLLESAKDIDRQKIKEKSLQAFRTGSLELRKRAVLALTKLGEVENF